MSHLNNDNEGSNTPNKVHKVNKGIHDDDSFDSYGDEAFEKALAEIPYEHISPYKDVGCRNNNKSKTNSEVAGECFFIHTNSKFFQHFALF